MSNRESDGAEHTAHTTHWYYRIASIVAVTAVLSYAAVQFVSPLLIFGGTDCSTSMGIQSCVGYPPTGIFAVIFASVVAVGAVESVWRNYHAQ